MSWHSPHHPVWSMVRLAIGMAGLWGVLAINADHFDVTEVRSICQAFFIFIGAEAITSGIARHRAHQAHPTDPVDHQRRA